LGLCPEGLGLGRCSIGPLLVGSSLPTLAEPRLQLAAGSGFQNPCNHLHPVMGTGVTGEVDGSPQAPPLGVSGTEHHLSHAGLHQSSGAHRTWLQGDDEGAVMKPPAAPQPRRSGQGHQLRMAEWILMAMASVAPPAHGLTFPIQHHRGHGHLPLPSHLIGPPQQPLHPRIPGIRPHGASAQSLAVRL